MSAEELVVKLTTGTVINQQRLASMKPEDVNTALADAYTTAPEGRVVVVENARMFFSQKNLLAAINEGDANLDLILERNNIPVTEDLINTVKAFTVAKAAILQAMKAQHPAPEYPFARVPENWSITTHIAIRTHLIRRLVGDSEYSIGLKSARALWNWVSPFWAGKTRTLDTHYVRANSTAYNATVDGSEIRVGCRRVQRYELEQIALSQGWDFPEMEATPA